MRKYELLFITYPDYDDEKIATLIDHYRGVITGGKGDVKTAEKWGKRRLAYELNGLREGTYILMTFEAEREVAAELDRVMKIDQDVVRHMISRVDHPRHKITPRKVVREVKTDEPKVEPTGAVLPVKVVRESPDEASAETDPGAKAPKVGETSEP